jgi:hypothetical protein
MLPQPGKQYVNWFYEENQKSNLDLKPKYQRNPIWSLGQRCFLIDSILSDCPIGQIYLNVLFQGSGRNRRTVYEVVDGQQRLRAILDFMRDSYALAKSAAKVYPVSQTYEKKLIGKHYSELPEESQGKIWSYPIAVQELRGYSESQVRDMFRRLNQVVERLSKQELRHSQYFGQFVKLVEELTAHPFWKRAELFSREDYQRMRDVEFVSELFVLVIDGIQDGQKTLDGFYAKYDLDFPKKSKYKSRFLAVLDSLEPLLPVISQTRFNKRADFYALFAATSRLLRARKHLPNLRKAAPKLKQLSRALEKAPEELVGKDRTYYSTVIEGPNKLTKRKARTELISQLLQQSLGI